jgi:hypothetical protein
MKVIKVETCGSCPFIRTDENWDSSCKLDKTISMPYSGDFNIDLSVHEKCSLRTQTVEIKLKAKPTVE